MPWPQLLRSISNCVLNKFFLKILKAVCLNFVHMNNIGPKQIQIVEHKLVQRCETHIEAQSCKAC